MNMQNKDKKKIRITLNSVGLVLLVIVLAAYIYVWRDNNAGQSAAVGITENIAAAQQQIKDMVAPPSDLQSQLDTLKVKLAADRFGFPAAVNRNDAIAYILDTAKENNIDILPLVSNGWVVENIGQIYNVLSISATAEGSLMNIKSFITDLQTGQFPTLTLSDCALTRISQTEMEVPVDELHVKMSMKICIYTFIPPAGKDAA